MAAARAAAALAVSKPIIAKAASSLTGTGLKPPDPSLLDRVGALIGIGSTKSAESRLAEAIAPLVSARAGDGLVEIEAGTSESTGAAPIATAVAEALLAEEDNAALARARRDQAIAAAQLQTLRTAARVAHERLAGLGATDNDPDDALAAAATATRAAVAHLTAIRSVVAAGSPPLGGGPDLPAGAAALQQSWWDLKRQLDTAVETLGDRHTTVIALRDGLARAAASLSAEWRRIERAAESDAATARSREAVLRKASAVQDPGRRIAIEDARNASRRADAAVAQAMASAVPVTAPASQFRLSAALPSAPGGLAVWQRAFAAAGAGFAGYVLGLRLLPRERRRGLAANENHRGEALARSGAAPRSGPLVAQRNIDTAPPRAVPRAVPRSGHDAAAASPAQEPIEVHLAGDWTAVTPLLAGSSKRQPRRPRLERGLRDALHEVAARLATARGVTTVMVASHDAGADTGPIALVLGEAAAELGLRVLVIECERAEASLAASVAPQGEPVLVDGFGALRVALPAERCDGLHLAPALRDGARIAGALARNTQTALVDARAYDAVVVDGGLAVTAAAADWTADAFIRVGLSASPRDDERLLALFRAPPEALLGTVAGGHFLVREIGALDPPPVPRPLPRPASRPRIEPLARRGASETLPAVRRRRVAAR